jgi:hypothetical protein
MRERTIIVVIVLTVYAIVTVLLTLADAQIIISALVSVASLILSAALVLATFAYTEAAEIQAQAMNRQAAAVTDPVVIFSVEEV